MNELLNFANKKFGIMRTIKEKDKILFCANDVTNALGYVNGRKAVGDHCKGVTKCDILTNGGNQNVTFITEGDVYRLIVRSKLPSAEEFEKWVFDEVLPTLRKTGGYVNNTELMINTYFGYCDDEAKAMIGQLLTNIEKQQAEIIKKNKEIEYKEDVIIGLDWSC